VDFGEVLVDDVNVKDYSLKNLRNGVWYCTAKECPVFPVL